MIALIPIARPDRGPETPVFYTVPWCPSVERLGREVPGSAWKSLVGFLEALSCMPADKAFLIRDASDLDLLEIAFHIVEPGKRITGSALLIGCRNLALELAILWPHS